MRRPILALSLLAACAGAALPGAAALASSARAADDDLNRDKAAVLRALSRPVSIDVRDQPVSDVFDFIARVTGADLEPVYLDQTTLEGIDPDTPVTIKATDQPALTLLERVLARVERAERPASGYTWQFTESGSIEFGPKSVLNRTQTVELYDVADLLFLVPRFDDAPEFDLSSAMQSQGGGGGSPFSGGTQQTDDPDPAERLDAITRLIEQTVEPDQWAGLGGDGAAITAIGTSLVVTAPDYVHRQINGYDFWPARLHQVRRVDGRTQVRVRPDPKARQADKP